MYADRPPGSLAFASLAKMVLLMTRGSVPPTGVSVVPGCEICRCDTGLVTVGRAERRIRQVVAGSVDRIGNDVIESRRGIFYNRIKTWFIGRRRIGGRGGIAGRGHIAGRGRMMSMMMSMVRGGSACCHDLPSQLARLRVRNGDVIKGSIEVEISDQPMANGILTSLRSAA